MRNSGIYQIRNLVNDKCYVGQTADFHKRWAQHYSALCLNRNKPSRYLQNVWNKHGEMNFFFEVLEIVGGNENNIEHFKLRLNSAEQYWIDRLQPNYNICPVAGTSLGCKQTEETNQKNSETSKGNKNCLGRTYSRESRQKMSRSQKGNKNSLGKKNSLGYKHTEKHKQKTAKIHAKPYPSFINRETGEVILTGINLSALCREHGLTQNGMWRVMWGKQRYYKNWSLLTK